MKKYIDGFAHAEQQAMIDFTPEGDFPLDGSIGIVALSIGGVVYEVQPEPSVDATDDIFSAKLSLHEGSIYGADTTLLPRIALWRRRMKEIKPFRPMEEKLVEVARKYPLTTEGRLELNGVRSGGILGLATIPILDNVIEGNFGDKS